MLINEVCRQCRLTKKAIEYYVEQKLVHPEILENGYRDFSISDAETLKKIAILRRLGLSVQSIREILNEENQRILYHISEKKRIAIETEKNKHHLIQQLAETQDWDSVSLQLESLEKRQTILERLLNIFPGYYGKYITLHFAPYLNEPIVSDEQQAAFETIIDFLDHTNFELPADLQQYFDEVTKNFDETFADRISANMNDAIYNTKKYLEDHRDVLEHYLQIKQSAEYKASPAYRLQEYLKNFNKESGYDTVFIPAMKKLSTSYREYHAALETANEVFLRKYPNTFT